MGQDYSYTQPSSSDEFDMTALLEEEAQLYRDEAQSRFNIAEQVQYTPQPEGDEGIPRACYCGAEPVVETSYTAKNPGRRYYTCDNVDDGDCHIWKWWDVAFTEEMSELQRHLRLVKEQCFDCDQKLVKLQKTVSKLKNTVCEQKKSVWEDNNTYIMVLVSILTVIIGFAVMFVTGIGSKK